MTQKPAPELSTYDNMLLDKLRKKHTQNCPACKHPHFLVPTDSSDSWLTIYCNNCGLRLQFLIDALLQDPNQEHTNDSP